MLLKNSRSVSFFKPIYFFTVILFYTCSINYCKAQNGLDKPLSKKEITYIIEKMSDSLEYYYVDIEMGIKIGSKLKKNNRNGLYKSIQSPEKLAKQLTKDLRSVNGDLHLSLEYINKKDRKSEENESETYNKYGASTNYGFQEIKFIEKNIAYIKINHFSNWDFANKGRQKVTEIMSLFKNSEAFIIDLRDNPGGVPYIVSYLSSYFFNDQPVHLADVYSRFNNYRYGIFTEPLVPGVKYPEVPLYILVNNKSASGAEEFAFWMQNQKRAIIIGQTTAGAGYGAMMHQLNERFSVSISSEDYIDSDTQKGFQTVGVIPDIIVNESLEYTTALELAKKAIKNEITRDTTCIQNFYKLLKKKHATISESEIFEQVMILHQLGHLDYDDIEKLGEKYASEPKKALPILRANTILYSFYPQPFDLYAEALASVGNYEMALLNYNKSLQLAKLKKNPYLNELKLNREKFIKKYEALLNDN